MSPVGLLLRCGLVPAPGQVLLDPNPARKPAWLEFTPAREGESGRVVLLPPAPVPVGTTEAAWPTPAECYLAELATVTSYSIGDSVSESTAGPEDTAEIVATVADSLLAVGALPVTNTMLRQFSGSRAPAWQLPLVSRWGRRAHHRVSLAALRVWRGVPSASARRHRDTSYIRRSARCATRLPAPGPLQHDFVEHLLSQGRWRMAERGKMLPAAADLSGRPC